MCSIYLDIIHIQFLEYLFHLYANLDHFDNHVSVLIFCPYKSVSHIYYKAVSPEGPDLSPNTFKITVISL